MLKSLAAILSTTLVAQVFSHFLAEPVGFDTTLNVGGCHDCGEKMIAFYECYHDALEPFCVDEHHCIINHAHWIECKDGDAPESDEDCVIHYDTEALWRIQYKVVSESTLECDELETFSPVPDQPEESNCTFANDEGNWKGKCYLVECHGSIIEQVSDDGNNMCGPEPP